MMRIDVWSDFGCPFCVIAKTKLEYALGKFAMREHVEVVYRSFQLDPHAKNRSLKIEQLAREKQMTVEQMKAKQVRVADMIKKETGLVANFDPYVISNTFDAHRLVHFAEQTGKGTEMMGRLFRAYLSQSLNIADHEVLVGLGMELGLDGREVANMLETNAYKDEVHADIAMARKFRISSLPAFVFNNKYLVSGAQPEEVLLHTMETVWEEDHQLLKVAGQDLSEGDTSCTDESCSI